MTTEVLMPALSPTMTAGNLLKWHVALGDKVSTGMVICEVETDKSVVEVEAEVSGIVTSIAVPEGTEEVPVNSVIAVVCAE